MTDTALDGAKMREALARLDARLPEGSSTRLVIGGGAAMVLAYAHPLATQDVDAFPARGGLSLAELDAAAKAVAAEMRIASDWLNGHFATFTFVLPADYATRLRPVFDGTRLSVHALGPEDLLVMKCFAGRDKDRPHAVKLMRLANDLGIVSRHLDLLVGKHIPGAQKAADYFDDLRDELDL